MSCFEQNPLNCKIQLVNEGARLQNFFRFVLKKKVKFLFGAKFRIA